MAVRKPLKLNGDIIQPMSTAEVNALLSRAIYAFSLNPAVTLSRVTSGGSLGSLTDTRLIAGAGSTRVDRYPTESETADVSTTTSSVARIDETVTNTSKPSKLLPALAYATPEGNIKAWTEEDLYDTLIHPAIDLLVSGSLTTYQAGTYFISTSNSVTGATLVDSNPVFTDTRANSSLYTSGGIPEDVDQPEIVQNYYLHQLNPSTNGISARPLCILNASEDPGGDAGNLKEYPLSDLDTYFQNAINYSASQEVGWRIRYSYTTGNNRGTMITDTNLDGSTYRTRFVNADDYRAQEHPSGSSTIINTYYLKINKS